MMMNNSKKLVIVMRNNELCTIEVVDNELLKWLRQKKVGHPIGKVHSIFNEVVNFISLDGAMLFSIAKNQVVQSPKMMKTKDTVSFRAMCLQLEVGDSIYLVENRSLVVKGWQWSLSSSVIWDRQLKTIPYEKSEFTYSHLTILNDYIRLEGKTGGAYYAWKKYNEPHWEVPSNVVNTLYFSPFLTALERLDQQIQAQELSSFLEQFVGLGIGLTPSGDDFLTGLLATWQYFRNPLAERALTNHKEEWIAQIRGKTTDVSHFMLNYCLEGQVNEALLSVLEHLNRDPAPYLQEVLAIGSTSGTDMLTGISFAYQQLLRNQEELV